MGIPLRVRKRVELLEVDVAQAGLLLQLAGRRRLHRLCLPDQPTGQGPHPVERRTTHLHQQHRELIPLHCEDIHIHCYPDFLFHSAHSYCIINIK